MKDVAQRCWACRGAQRASKRPKKLQGGILDSSILDSSTVCSLTPDFWGDCTKRPLMIKDLMSLAGSHKNVIDCTSKKTKVTENESQRKVGEIIRKVGVPRWAQRSIIRFRMVSAIGPDSGPNFWSRALKLTYSMFGPSHKYAPYSNKGCPCANPIRMSPCHSIGSHNITGIQYPRIFGKCSVADSVPLRPTEQKIGMPSFHSQLCCSVTS